MHVLLPLLLSNRLDGGPSKNAFYSFEEFLHAVQLFAFCAKVVALGRLSPARYHVLIIISSSTGDYCRRWYR